MEANSLSFSHVYGWVPAITVVGPLIVLAGSEARCVQSSMDRFVLPVADMPTMPTFPAESTPTVGNSGLKLAPAILAVWLTAHAAVFEQSKSTQNATLLVSVPCASHALVQGPEPSTP